MRVRACPLKGSETYGRQNVRAGWGAECMTGDDRTRAMAPNRSWPAMSQSCSRTTCPSTLSCLRAKSTPTVLLWWLEKMSCTYRLMTLDLPVAGSPSTRILITEPSAPAVGILWSEVPPLTRFDSRKSRRASTGFHPNFVALWPRV